MAARARLQACNRGSIQAVLEAGQERSVPENRRCDSSFRGTARPEHYGKAVTEPNVVGGAVQAFLMASAPPISSARRTISARSGVVTGTPTRIFPAATSGSYRGRLRVGK